MSAKKFNVQRAIELGRVTWNEKERTLNGNRYSLEDIDS